MHGHAFRRSLFAPLLLMPRLTVSNFHTKWYPTQVQFLAELVAEKPDIPFRHSLGGAGKKYEMRRTRVYLRCIPDLSAARQWMMALYCMGPPGDLPCGYTAFPFAIEIHHTRIYVFKTLLTKC